MVEPRDVIYGYYEPHDSLAVVERSRLLGIVQDIERLDEVSTAGELRTVLASLTEAAWLLDDDKEIDDLADDEPWSWSDLGPVAEGDWPPMPTAAALELFDDDPAVRRDFRQSVELVVEATTLSGDFGWIARDKEPELLAFFDRHGIAATRDDDLILRASNYA